MTSTASTRAQSVRRILWIVMALNLAVTCVKIAVGLASHSLSVTADAFQSLVDASSNVVGLLGMWVSARPADENHPYGHHKYESIAAMGIGAMLLAAGYEIGKGVVARFVGAPPTLHITPATFALMGLTFAVNVGIVTYETRAGRRLHNDILLADAAQTRTNLYVTVSVLASLLGAYLGLIWLDPLVAAGILFFIFRSAFSIFRSTSNILTDVAVADPNEVERIAAGVPGVIHAGAVRSRGRADAVYIDLHIQVNPAMDTDQAHGVASEVERRINAGVPGVVDTVVHIEPGRDAAPQPWEELSLKLRGLADGMGVGLHDLHAHAERGGGYAVEAHLEVKASLTLGAAHMLADDLEQRVLATLPQVRSFVTHIEPLPADLPDEAGHVARMEALRRRITQLTDGIAGKGACHSVQLHNVGGHLTATLHVTQSADKPLTAAHALAEQIERELHAHETRLRRVLVHVEPPE